MVTGVWQLSMEPDVREVLHYFRALLRYRTEVEQVQNVVRIETPPGAMALILFEVGSQPISLEDGSLLLWIGPTLIRCTLHPSRHRDNRGRIDMTFVSPELPASALVH